MSQVRKVLVAVDFSECSKKTLHYAFNFFKGCGTEFHVIYVEPGPFPEGSYIPHRSVDEMEENSTAYFAEELKKFIPRNYRNTENVQPVLLKGVPYSKIVAYAKEQEIDLIIIGSHGMTPLEKMLLGSVADKVIRKSTIPILVVKH